MTVCLSRDVYMRHLRQYFPAFRYLPRAPFGPRPRPVSAQTIRPAKPAIRVDKYFARLAVNRACFIPCLFGDFRSNIFTTA